MDASPEKDVGIDSNQKTGRMLNNLSGLEFNKNIFLRNKTVPSVFFLAPCA